MREELRNGWTAEELRGDRALGGNGELAAWLRGEEEWTRPASEAAGAGHRCGHDGLPCGPGTGVWSPPGTSGLTVVGRDGQAKMAISAPSVSLTAPKHTLLTPKLRRVSKNSVNKSSRATCKLQLCLSELGPILAGLQIAMRQSIAHETINQFYTW